MNGYPLKIVAAEKREVEADFNAEFLVHMLPKMEWSAFVAAAKDIGLDNIPGEIPDDAASDEEFLKEEEEREETLKGLLAKLYVINFSCASNSRIRYNTTLLQILESCVGELKIEKLSMGHRGLSRCSEIRSRKSQELLQSCKGMRRIETLQARSSNYCTRRGCSGGWTSRFVVQASCKTRTETCRASKT